MGAGVAGFAWDAPRARAALLLQHGFAEYAERYVEQYGALVPRLIELGVSVFAFDLEGHGRSPGRRGSANVERAVGQHLAARRKLSAERLPVFLMGHSLGGLVTATSVVRDPAGVAGVILSSPVLQVTTNALERLLARWIAPRFPNLPGRMLDRRGLSRIPEQRALVAGDPRMYQGAMPAGLGASILTAVDASWPHYREWQVPTLVIHGTADRITEVEGSRRFARTIASPDKTLHLVEGGYHELLNDVGRQETLRVVLGWFDARLPLH
ncbi:MAG TPA: alpha/beta hydrolase [Gemmatimonadaceae bacterium]|nr:alpha/beta hydrolase [Gemmatimonadaceae bacterium]